MDIKRYCTSCQQYVTVQIASLEDMEHLVCPQCGQQIAKDSRPTVANGGKKPDQAEALVTKGFITYFNIRYYLYLALAMVGLVGYAVGSSKLTYGTAIVLLFIFTLWSLMVTRYDFVFALVVAVAEIAVYVMMDATLMQLCLVLFVAFIVRHLIKEVIFKFWGRVISWAGRQK